MERDSDGRSALIADLDEGDATSPFCDGPFTETTPDVRLHVEN